MNNNNNMLDPKEYLFDIELQEALESGYLKDSDKSIGWSKKGVYLVMFKILNKDKNVFVFNYISYPFIFRKTLILYLFNRDRFCDSYPYRERGDHLTILDLDLFLGEVNHRLILHNCNPVASDILAERFDLKTVFEWINRLLYLVDHEDRIDLFDLACKKDYFKFMDKILSNMEGYSEVKDGLCYVNENEIPVNIINGCLFVISDLNSFINSIEKKGYVVNGGPQKYRSQVNSIGSYLSCLDIDFRNSLYNHNRHHIHRGTIDSRRELKKSSFSFNNIHMNLGNVKWYSTNRPKVDYNFVLDETSIRGRQQLFQVNYNLVDDILSKNFYVGSKELQEEIEYVLNNQESVFSDLNTIKFKLNFSDDSFELIKNKYLDLCKFFSNPDDFVGNKQFHSIEFIPWVKKIIDELGGEAVSNLLLSYFMSILVNENTIVDEIETPGIPTITAFNDFGKKIVDKFIFNKYIKSDIKKNKGSLSEFKHHNRIAFYDIYNTDNFYARVGGFFVWNLVTVKLLYQDLDRNPSNTSETVYYLRIVRDVRVLLMKDKSKVYHIPQKLPMVCEPKDFVYSLDPLKNKLGGYLLNDIYYTEGIFKDKIGYGKPTVLQDENLIVSLINGLSKTPYKINIDTLNFIYKYGIVKRIILDNSSEEIKSFMNNPYKGYSLEHSKKYRSIVSKIIMERNILSIAKIYCNVDKIYFPVRLDQRTRIYCKTDYFDYQKSDLAKGLISFVRPGIITKLDVEVIKYFKAYGANMFGDNLDKKSINFREKWVDDNSDKILNFEFNDIVDKAENKACFISFCFEYKRYMEFIDNKDKNMFYTYLPIQLDASCNGYQHLVLLTKESKLQNKLNLDVSSHDDDPNDFYTYIQDKMLEYIKSKIVELSKRKVSEKTEKDLKLLDSFNRLQKVHLDRSIVKKTIMTESYSAGIPKLVQNILSNLTEHGIGKEQFYTHKDSNIKLSRDDILTFVMCLKYVVKTESPKIKELSKYLDGIVSVCTKLSFPVPWTLPHGAEIQGSYLIEKVQKIPAFSFVKSQYTFKKYLKGEYDIKKQQRAIRPNLIHSLDATSIAMLYDNFKDIDLYTIHDCFAVTANRVPYLIQTLKMVYIKLYSTNTYLIQFDNLVKISINKTFSDKIYKINDKYINIPYKNGFKRILFPDVYKIVTSDDNSVDNLKFSSNIII